MTARQIVSRLIESTAGLSEAEGDKPRIIWADGSPLDRVVKLVAAVAQPVNPPPTATEAAPNVYQWDRDIVAELERRKPLAAEVVMVYANRDETLVAVVLEADVPVLRGRLERLSARALVKHQLG